MSSIGKILTFLLLVVFFIPAAGFYYNKHSCSESGLVQVVLDSDYSCCEGNSQDACMDPDMIETSENQSCCASGLENPESSSGVADLPFSIQETDTECCFNDGRYLKSAEKYYFPYKTKFSDNPIHFSIALHSINSIPDSHVTVSEQGHSPPLNTSSREILLKNSVFLI